MEAGGSGDTGISLISIIYEIYAPTYIIKSKHKEKSQSLGRSPLDKEERYTIKIFCLHGFTLLARKGGYPFIEK